MNVPKLRFKEFDGEWEEINLKKLLSLLKDGTHGTHKDVLKGPYLLSAKNIINGAIRISENDRKISMEEFNSIYKNYELRKGDVLLSIVGTIGRTAIVSDEKLIAFQRSVAILRSEKLFPSFLLYLIQSQNFQHQLQVKKVVSAQPGVYLGDIGKIKVNVPEMNEQKKISDLLLSLDKKIQLQQQKIDLLQEQKKGYMQKVFSKQVALKREWVTYKFKDMIENIRGGGTPSKEIKEYYEGNIPWITVKDLKDFKYIIDSKDHITEKALENSSSKLIDVDDLIIPTRMAVGKFFISKNKMAINQDLKGITLKNNFDVEFVYYLLISQAHRLEQLSSGSTVSGINVDDLKGLELTCPSLSEQVKVAKILSLLDFKIDLNKKKLSNILKQKQGFMQQMFI